MSRTRPDPHHANRRVADALEDLIYACSDLAKRSCTILRTRTDRDLPHPVIIIAPPTGRALRGLEFGTKTTTHNYTTYAGRVGCCQFEWTERRGRAAA